MKYSIKILLIIEIILISFSSCDKQKEVKVIGFAYRDDSVILNTEQNKLLKIKINGKENENGICSFYQKIKLYSEKNDIKVAVVIDSNNVRVLDTFVIIPKTYKQPFISFLNPYSQRKYKREIFIADEADSIFIKE